MTPCEKALWLETLLDLPRRPVGIHFLITKEAYDAFGAAYRKVAIGKGLIDKERIQYLINRYAKFVK